MSTMTLTENELTRRSRLTLLALTALFLAAMDATVVGTLIPVFRHEFDQPQEFPWLMSGFILAAVLAMPLSGLLADRMGLKRVIIGSLALFMAGSVVVAMAPDMRSLIGGRVLQGVGSGGITVLVYTLIGGLYGPEERGRMQGLLSAVWGLAAIAGPVIGAAVHTWIDWHWVFWANVPLISVLILAAALLMPEEDLQPSVSGFDLAGFTGFCALASGVLLWLMAPDGPGDDMIRMGYAGVTLTGVLLVAQSLWRRRERAFLAVEFFRERSFVTVMISILLSAAILYACVTLLPVYMVEVLGRSLVDAGGVVLAASLGWVVGATVCGNLVNRLGTRNCTMLGFLLLLAGAGLLLAPGLNTLFAVLLLAQVSVGVGIGFVATATLILAQNRTRPQRLGQVTAAVQVFRQLGAAVGINALGALFISGSSAGAEAQALQMSFAVLGACALAGLLSALLIRDPRKASGQEVSQ